MLESFKPLTVERQGVQLHTRAAGEGPPVLLLHGHPQTMAMWHRVAPVLAQTHRVVLMDLRGYGDSSRPAADATHTNHSKREMALDALAVMKAHGFERFDLLARVRHLPFPGGPARTPLLVAAMMYYRIRDALS